MSEKITVDASKAITDIDGNTIDTTIGDAIAMILANEKTNDVLRAYELALVFKKSNKAIELSESDRAFVREAVQQSQTMRPFVVAQALMALK